MSAPHQDDIIEDEPEMLDADEAGEVIEDDGDIAMDSDDEGGDRVEMDFQNDSVAYFDSHKHAIYAIAQHPTLPTLIATGGSEGEEESDPGKGYVFDTSPVVGRPVLPQSYNADPTAPQQRSTELTPLFAIDGHTDSVNALAFTLPRGEYLVSGGLDGRLRAHTLKIDARNKASFSFLAESQEVQEINWIAPCPVVGADSPAAPNTIALGADDGSVWVYTIDASDASNPLQIVQSYYLHGGPCTAGAWSPDGKFLATVAEDSTLNVWDVWGVAAAKGLTNPNGQTVVSLTVFKDEADNMKQRKKDEDEEPERLGLFSVAVDPKSSFVAVGGFYPGNPCLKIVSLPHFGTGGSKNTKGDKPGGAILMELPVQRESVETLAFSPGKPLLAAGSVDGSIVVYDTSKNFRAKRTINEAHDHAAVVKLDFVRSHGDGWLLTSCGMDGVVRRWNIQGEADAVADSMVREWRGHSPIDETGRGGILGFVQGSTGERIVTAGDDGLALVFET
ncbi:WD40-repeat-containing domain protein [Xylariaceae sp. FL0594]|nr:WD40-repeat-containing domain protein [Xylariaceae sp. FL0594]